MELGQIIRSLRDGCKVISLQYSKPAVEYADSARDEQFRLALAAWIQQQLPTFRMTRLVLLVPSRFPFSQRHPNAFPAPRAVNDLHLQREKLTKEFASSWGRVGLPLGKEI